MRNDMWVKNIFISVYRFEHIIVLKIHEREKKHKKQKNTEPASNI